MEKKDERKKYQERGRRIIKKMHKKPIKKEGLNFVFKNRF